jgi:predicted metal-dependent hydrolase
MAKTLSLRYGDEVITVGLVTHSRATSKLRIRVQPSGTVTVEVPAGGNTTEVSQALTKRVRWIFEKVRSARAERHGLSRREWVSGESHTYLGRKYVLKVTHDTGIPESVKLIGGQLRVNTHLRSAEIVRVAALRWYRERAKEIYSKRLADAADSLPWVKKLPPIALREMRTRWASCSPAGRLTVNPLLVRARREHIDYVLIHELCHLKLHDHSKAFYRLLDRHVPDWRRTKLQLDGMAARLFNEIG